MVDIIPDHMNDLNEIDKSVMIMRIYFLFFMIRMVCMLKHHVFRFFLFAGLIAVTVSFANAGSTTPTAVASAPIPNKQPFIIPPAPQIDAKSYVLMDVDTGMVIAHHNMNEKMPPASLTKLMTLYLVSQALAQGQIKLTDKVHINEKAWRTGGSRMFLKEGSDVSVQDLINGVIVASGNDACVALAQYAGGNETTFANMMNQAAEQLGMKNTHFVDSTGLPDPQHYSTSYDLALLTRAIITRFPQDYTWYKQKWITYNNIKQPNRNRLLWRDSSVDGLKTGHTEAAGFCLIASALRNNMRLIAAVMNAPSDVARTDDTEALFNWGFRFYQSHQLFEANKTLATPHVWLGKHGTVKLGLTEPLVVTIPTGSYAQLKPQIDINTHLKAPIKKGNSYGSLNIYLNSNVITRAPLVALEDDPTGNIFSRLWDRLLMLFKK